MDGVAGGGAWGGQERQGSGLVAVWRWLASALSARRQELPPIRDAKPPAPLEIRRSAIGCAWEARLAVRSGVRLEDFLRHRLARYASQLRIPESDLPVVLDVEGGEPVVRPRPSPGKTAASWRGDDDARWLRALVDLEGPVAAREIRDAEAAAAALDERAAAQCRRVDEIAGRLAGDLESGALVAAPRVEATPEQLGRPPVPSAAPLHALHGLAASLLVAETWQLARPVLALTGHDAGALAAEASRDPLGVTLGLVLALGAATSIFVLALAAVRRFAELAGPADPARQRRLAGAGATSAALGAVAIAFVGAGLAPDPLPRAVLLSTLPFAAALLLRAAAALRVPRAGALAAALEWDRARVAEADARTQRAEALALAREELRALEAERARMAKRVRALHARAVAAGKRADEDARATARNLERLSDAIASALELDRYAFVRLASDATHEALVRPMRPERYEPAMAPERFVAG